MPQFHLIVDTNHSVILTRLNFYLKTEQLLVPSVLPSDAERHFILDMVEHLPGKRSVVYLTPRDPVTVFFEDRTIEIVYSTSREPRNYHTTEMRFDRMTLTSEVSVEHLSRFVEMLNNLVLPDGVENELNMYVWKESFREWLFSRSFTQRKLETIYFPQKTDIVQTLEHFLTQTSTQQLYRDLDIPYKFVSLFHGLPGTGKTSMIRALASHFGYNLSFVKHSQDMDDTSLERMITRLKPRSFLVFEDIDCIFDQRELRTKNSISYSGILNMLDGVGNYDKFVVFITTNHLQHLDSAFKRRIDMFVEFGYIQKTEALQMYARFFPQASSDEAVQFWNRVRHKSLTVNMLEKHFMYSLRKNMSPLDDIEHLETYTEMTSERTISHLYN